MCAAQGRRLCTVAELSDRRCCRTGCSLDSKRVWSNSSCDKRGGWEPALTRAYEYPCRPGLLDARSRYARTFVELPAFAPAPTPPPPSAIPRVVVLALKSLRVPERMATHLAQLQQSNPTYARRIFTDAAMEAFIDAEGGRGNSTTPVTSHAANSNSSSRSSLGAAVAKAYYMLASPALRSDLFRVYYLYRRGGLWIDGDCSVPKPLPIHRRDQLVIAMQAGQGFGKKKFGETVCQSTFGSAPGHPALLAAVVRIVDNVVRRRSDRGAGSSYPGRDVGLEAGYTGPIVLHQAFRDACGVERFVPGTHRIRRTGRGPAPAGGPWTFTVHAPDMHLNTVLGGAALPGFTTAARASFPRAQPAPAHREPRRALATQRHLISFPASFCSLALLDFQVPSCTSGRSATRTRPPSASKGGRGCASSWMGPT